jgi:hypothetical protein
MKILHFAQNLKSDSPLFDQLKPPDYKIITDFERLPFSHQWLYSPSLGPGLFFSFVIFFTQTVGLLGRVISPSQGLYLNTE